MPELAKTARSVERNIDSYWDGAHENFELIKDAAKVRKWKCYRASDGSWRCGPSRFVGYEGMNPKKYIQHKQSSAAGGLHGTETEYHLRQWTEEVKESSKLHDRLYNVVESFLHAAGVSVNRSARFSILTQTNDYSEPEDPDEEAMKALFTLSQALPVSYRRALIRRLESLPDVDG